MSCLPGRTHQSFCQKLSTHPPTHPPEKKTTSRLFFERKKTTFRCFPLFPAVFCPFSRCFPLFSLPGPWKKIRCEKVVSSSKFCFFPPHRPVVVACVLLGVKHGVKHGVSHGVGRRTLFPHPLVTPCHTLWPHRVPDPVLHWCHTERAGPLYIIT